MRMRTKVSIVTMVGTGALLLCALAAIIAFRSQVANASVNPPHGDHGPYVEIALLDTTVAPGEYLSFGALFHGMPCQDHPDQSLCNYEENFADGLDYEYEVLDSNGAPTDKCEFSGNGGSIINRKLRGSYRHWKTLGSFSYRISSDCEPGSYRIRLTLTHSSCSDENAQCTDSESFHVSAPTSMPTGGGNQGGGNQGGGNQGGGNQGGGNQGGGNQGGGNQGGGNQGGATRAAAIRAAATRVAATRVAATRYRPTGPRRQQRHPPRRQQRHPPQRQQRHPPQRQQRHPPQRQQRHPPRRVSRSSGNNKYQSCPQPRPRQRHNRAAKTKATTKATIRAAAATRDAATTRAAASSHLSTPRPRHHHHHLNSSRRRRSPSPCRSY